MQCGQGDTENVSEAASDARECKEKDTESKAAADSGTAAGENDADGEIGFRQAVLRLRQEKTQRAENIVRLVAGLCKTDSRDYDGIENAVMQGNFERCRKNDMEYRLGQWQRESESVRELYPEFDLAGEMKNREFFSLCYKGVGLAEAYLIVHKDELFRAAVEYAAAEVMKNGALGQGRAREGMLSGIGAAKPFQKKLSKSERNELIRRTERGERVVL